MIALFFLAAALGEWVPMRWPAADPAALDLLTGTPVNCILLEPEAWSPAVLDEAKRRGIHVLAVIHPGQQASDLAHRAGTMAFDGLVLEGDFTPVECDRLRSGPIRTVIELPARHAMRLEPGVPAVGSYQGVWPGIEIEHGGKVMTGPTSAPWIHTNSGFLRFARASTDAPVWIGVRPPPDTIFRPERYVQAIADASVCGARWIIALDDNLQSRLLKRDPAAIADWKFITRHLAFLEQHAQARQWREWSQFGVAQDAASGGLLTGGLLDMLSSQKTSIRVVPIPRLEPAALQEARILLDVAPERLTPPQKEVLDGFAKGGGQVLDPPAGWHFPVVPESEFVLGRRQLDAMQPLWEITYKATLRKNFGVRTFNTAGVLSNAVTSPDGKNLIVYLANFTDGPVENVTVHALGNWTTARLISPDSKTRELEMYPVAGGTGIDIETLGALAIVQLER